MSCLKILGLLRHALPSLYRTCKDNGISAKGTFLVGVERCTMTTHRTAISVFLSYAHEDEPLLRQLETHLSLLKRQGLISTWYNRQIVPGTNWAKVIDEQLEQA